MPHWEYKVARGLILHRIDYNDFDNEGTIVLADAIRQCSKLEQVVYDPVAALLMRHRATADHGACRHRRRCTKAWLASRSK